MKFWPKDRNFSQKSPKFGDEPKCSEKIISQNIFRANGKNAIKNYSQEIGLSVETGVIFENYVSLFAPIVKNAIFIFENELDQVSLGWTVHWSYMDFAQNVFFDPLDGVCEQKIGPFQAIRQMTNQIYNAFD